MKKRLDFRIEEYEFQILEDYCELVGRTKTDVLRELIRGLKTKKKPSSEGRGFRPIFLVKSNLDDRSIADPLRWRSPRRAALTSFFADSDRFQAAAKTSIWADAGLIIN